MSIKPSLAVLTLILVTLCASTPCGAQDSAGEDSQKPSAPSRYDILVRHAKAKLDLAKVELQYAEKENAKLPGLIARLAIERLKSNVSLAKAQLEEATLASAGGSERVQLRHAEEKIRLAQLELRSGQKQRKSGLIGDLELHRLELRTELANLELLLLQNPENFVTLLHHLEVKVNRMGDEILSLDQRISRLEPTRGVLPKN